MNYRDRGDHRTLRVIRSTTSLVIIALALGAALAVVLGGTVWLIATALHHASSS